MTNSDRPSRVTLWFHGTNRLAQVVVGVLAVGAAAATALGSAAQLWLVAGFLLALPALSWRWSRHVERVVNRGAGFWVGGLAGLGTASALSIFILVVGDVTTRSESVAAVPLLSMYPTVPLVALAANVAVSMIACCAYAAYVLTDWHPLDYLFAVVVTTGGFLVPITTFVAAVSMVESVIGL